MQRLLKKRKRNSKTGSQVHKFTIKASSGLLKKAMNVDNYCPKCSTKKKKLKTTKPL